MSIVAYVLLGFFLLANTTAFSANRQVHMQPDVVALKGFAKRMLCPGPPNYEDIKKGDMPERCGYLFLNNPIDTDVLPGVEVLSAGMDEPEKGVSIVQVVLTSDTNYWGSIPPTGRYVQITGTLFSHFTGHHHVRVLIEVQKMKTISSKGLELAYKHAKAIKTCKAMTAEDWPSRDPD